MEKKIYVIDGEHFSNLEEFYEEISEVIVPGVDWGNNLDSLDDIFCGWYGTPEGGFTLIWRNSEKSKTDLGFKETVNFYQRKDQWVTDGLSFEEWFERWQKGFSSDAVENKMDKTEIRSTANQIYNSFKDELAAAQNHQGKTLFDIVLEIITSHPKIELRLE